MQLIEKSAFFLRSAIYRLTKNDGTPDYMLFPMIHIGSEDYYHDIAEMLDECDVILFESVATKKLKFLISCYHKLAKSERFKLSTQSSMDISQVSIKNIRGKRSNGL